MNDELLIKLLLNEATAAETEEIQKWIAESTENEKYYRQFERIWNESETLINASPVNENVAWEKFKMRVDGQKATVPIVAKLKPAKLWFRIAAVLICCFGAWLAYEKLAGSYTDIASHDLVLNQELPDGSRLVLNKNTNISYATDFKSNRKVELIDGEVFFEVAHDRAHPFVIAIKNVKVEVVGTSFNIKRLKNAVEVIVETGVVKVNKNGNQLVLIKGESILLKDEASSLEKKPIEDELHSYYRTQLFLANNTPLPRLIATLNEAYRAEIILDGQINHLRISTTLPYNYSLEKNLETICETLDLKMQRNQNGILLSKR